MKTIPNERARAAAERCERIDDSRRAPQLSALDVFSAEPTPKNAVALAIADHRAGPLTDWTYVDQLRKAEERLAAYQKLVERLRDVSGCHELVDAKEITQAILRDLGEVA